MSNTIAQVRRSPETCWPKTGAADKIPNDSCISNARALLAELQPARIAHADLKMVLACYDVPLGFDSFAWLVGGQHRTARLDTTHGDL